MARQTMTSRLCQQFTRRIRSGEWERNRPIPTERDLMRQYKASRSTIRAALQQLERKGWLEATRGSGRRVKGTDAGCGMVGLMARSDQDFRGGQGERFRQSVEAALQAHGHDMMMFTIDTDRRRITARDESGEVDLDEICGAIVYAWEYEEEDIARLARQMPVAAVMTHDAVEVGVPSFFVDYAYHAGVAVRELVKLGHQRIAMMGPPRPGHSQFWRDLRRGFDLGASFSDLERHDTRVVHWSHETDSRQALYEQVMEGAEGPTALISHQDRPILAMLQEARRRGVDLADHLAIVCLVDLSNRSGLVSDVAYFATPIERMAEHAAAWLHEAMEGGTSTDHANPYYGQLKPRGTLTRASKLAKTSSP